MELQPAQHGQSWYSLATITARSPQCSPQHRSSEQMQFGVTSGRQSCVPAVAGRDQQHQCWRGRKILLSLSQLHSAGSQITTDFGKLIRGGKKPLLFLLRYFLSCSRRYKSRCCITQEIFPAIPSRGQQILTPHFLPQLRTGISIELSLLSSVHSKPPRTSELLQPPSLRAPEELRVLQGPGKTSFDVCFFGGFWFVCLVFFWVGKEILKEFSLPFFFLPCLYFSS